MALCTGVITPYVLIVRPSNTSAESSLTNGKCFVVITCRGRLTQTLQPQRSLA
uniref:Uncharacterized protein n=1 Tax=Hyaloperonospora arabidopsidis (strain Emoy2) TaxID=559515 RepID=M4B8R3_HYAAE